MIIGISGSATPDGSTDIIVKEILRGATDNKKHKAFYRLNEMRILPCQACGKSPEPEFCFFHDDAYQLLNRIAESDIIVLGSPIYFDSVTAQTKLLIDRSNCFRPADFTDKTRQKFVEPKLKGKSGGIVLVAGDYGKFDTALRTMRAFFIWAGIDIKFELTYQTKSFEIGEAAADKLILSKAFQTGKSLAEIINE
jgi:multimeric flavodoxin WrbA